MLKINEAQAQPKSAEITWKLLLKRFSSFSSFSLYVKKLSRKMTYTKFIYVDILWSRIKCIYLSFYLEKYLFV